MDRRGPSGPRIVIQLYARSSGVPDVYQWSVFDEACQLIEEGDQDTPVDAMIAATLVAKRLDERWTQSACSNVCHWAAHAYAEGSHRMKMEVG